MNFQIPWNVYQQNHRYKSQALYHALRDAIVSGTLPYDSKLPSHRELAELYEVSRGVVAQVYDMLTAEGYLSSAVGRGTFVAYNHHHTPSPQPNTEPIQLSAWGRRLLEVPFRHLRHLAPADITYDFSIGRTDSSLFPYTEWNRTLYESVRTLANSQRQEAFASAGHYPLRESIARYLRRARGIEADAEDVVIVNGSMQAIALLAQLLVEPGDPVVVEDPCYRGIWQAIDAVGGTLLPSPVDTQGLQVDDWPARLLFVTPSRQFPTGSVLSLQRRQEILHWAARRHAVIVEDDYDSEFRHSGRPIEPLKVLNHDDRVVYIGTFSKTMFSDIRIGYVVLPRWLNTPFCKAQHLYEPHPTSLLQQQAVCAFMNSGHYERHLRRMKRHYSKKHKLCSQALQKHLGHLFDFVEGDAGLHIFGWWKGSLEAYESLRQRCRAQGIVWSDAGSYTLQPGKTGGCFGFAHLTEEEIIAGILAIAAI